MDVQVPFELHSGIAMKHELIGQYDVTIKVPTPDEQCNTIVLTGQLTNVSKAKEAILDYVASQQTKKELDRDLIKELFSLKSQCAILMEKVKC